VDSAVFESPVLGQTVYCAAAGSAPRPGACSFPRIVVAHGASRSCHDRFGGSGSLIDTRIVDEQLAHPFVLGRIDAKEGYVHVFDDTSLNVLMTYLDTISDFIGYLTKKEELLAYGVQVLAAARRNFLPNMFRN
jgi:hypothetical protein